MLDTPLLDMVVPDRPAVNALRLTLEVRPQPAVLHYRRQVIEVGNVVDRWQTPGPYQSD